MAKKKQLAGKTTKLAKLPLTQALAEQAEEAGRHLPPVPPSPGAAEPLGAIYLHLIRELTSLLSELRVPEDSVQPRQTYLPPHVPMPQQLRQSLKIAQQGLRELHLLLSQP